MIRKRHVERSINRGDADWLLIGRTETGLGLKIVYDHPGDGDVNTIRIVSIWRL